MKEGKRGVQRLLRAVYEQIDDEKIGILAWLLNYDQGTLKDDIESILDVAVVDKDEQED